MASASVTSKPSIVAAASGGSAAARMCLPSPGMGFGRSSERLLLERAAELAAIGAAIDAACAGIGSVLLVEGAAGIGKTRLLAHACEQAAAAGMTVLSARAAEYEDGYAWGVVRQLFEAELRSVSPGGQPPGDPPAWGGYPPPHSPLAPGIRP